MNSASPNDASLDDASIPLLTDVLDIPPPPAQPATAAAEPGPALSEDEDALLVRLRAPILRDIHDRLDPVLEARAHAAVAAQAPRIADEIAAALREELTRMVNEALHKELIRLESAKTKGS